MTFVSYAQNFEDVMLWRALKHVSQGFYIDVGAAHPDTDSVTRAFYDLGWNGINIEPAEEYARRLRTSRVRDITLQVALGDTAGLSAFFVVDPTGLSTMGSDQASQLRQTGLHVERVVVEVDTLAAVCRAHALADIHFLKIDVEGSERAVLAGADFTVFRPWIVLVEATAPMSTTETHAAWEPILLGAAYRFVWFDGLNRFYVSEERYEELSHHFRIPVNVFDDFLRTADTEWARRIHHSEILVTELRQTAEDLRQRLIESQKSAEGFRQRLVGTQKTTEDFQQKWVQSRESAEDLAQRLAESQKRAEDLRQELALTQTNLEAKLATLDERARTISEFVSNESTYRAAIEQRDRELSRVGRELEAVYLSTSWRVTEPLRGLAARHPRAAGSLRGFMSHHPKMRRLAGRIMRRSARVATPPAAEPALTVISEPLRPALAPDFAAQDGVRPIACDPKRAMATASEPLRWFFLGDTIDWLTAHEQVTGVGKVTTELFFASLSDTSRHKMIPCALAHNDVGLGSISLRDSAAYLASRVGVRAPSELLEAMDRVVSPPAVAFSPAPGDHVLFTGVVWTPGYRALFQNLSERGIRFSVLVYDIIPIEHPGFVTETHHQAFTEWLQTTVALASAVFVSSRTIKDQILRWAALSATPVTAAVIPVEFGSSESRRPALAGQLCGHGAASRIRLSWFVLSVGTIDRRKNQVLLCRVWQRLIADLGRAKVPQLVLVGRDDLNLATLSEDVAAMLGASDIVLLEGAGDADLAELYRNCLLTAFPSLSEGYGLPVAESLAHGKLCLSSDLRVIREHAGDLPWYFAPDDEDAAYSTFRRALDDPDARMAAEAQISREYLPRSWESTYESITRSVVPLADRCFPPRLERQSRPAIPGVGVAPIPAVLATAQDWCTDLNPEVSIIIINWDASQLTCECVRQIWANTTGVMYEVIIADNGSDLGELALLSQLGSGVRLLALSINRYFGEANNIAVEHARGRYICLLNNDAFVQAGWLSHLVDDLRNDPEAGVVGPLFLFPDGTIQEAGGSIDMAGYPVRFGRGQNLDSQEFLSPRVVDYVSAALLLVPRDLYLAAGGFDLLYEPAYYEDADLCFKIRALGRKIRYCPAARVVHIEGSSANDNQLADARRKALGDLNRGKFVSRWAPYLQGRSDAYLQSAAEQALIRTGWQASKESTSTRRAAALFTPFELTPGGGERFLLTIAAILSKRYDVTIVTLYAYSFLRLLNMGRELCIDLSECRMTTSSEFCSAPDPDLMIVMGNYIVPPIPARAENSLFICQFPFPLATSDVREARKSVGSYRAVITYSEYVRAHVLAALSAYQMPPWPVEVVYPPVPQFVGNAEQKKTMILSVGRFFAGGHSKRHDLMISAFSILLKRLNGQVELHLAGSSMPRPEHMDYLSDLRQMATGLPIIFHVNPSTEALSDLYRDAAVYWHATGLEVDLAQEPERAEHFGISIVEAMSAGCVPLAFNAGGVREIITHGVDGLLYSSLDQLVDLTEQLLHSDGLALRESLGRAAAQRAPAFSPEAFAVQVQQVIGS